MTNHNHVARERNQWSLTQPDLAFLLGTTRENISRIEVSEGTTSVERAFVLEALFGVPVSQLFPNIYEAAYNVLVPRLAQWSMTLEGDESPDALRKRELLIDFASRAPANGNGV